jgi:hypothetical protein
MVLESPYRAIIEPLLACSDRIDAEDPIDTLTVVLPEFVPDHWWEHALHNQTALRLKAVLLYRPGTVVTSVPYHLPRKRRMGPCTPPPKVRSPQLKGRLGEHADPRVDDPAFDGRAAARRPRESP